MWQEDGSFVFVPVIVGEDLHVTRQKQASARRRVILKRKIRQLGVCVPQAITFDFFKLMAFYNRMREQVAARALRGRAAPRKV